MTNKEEEVFSRAPEYRKYYVTNVKGGMTEHDIRFELLNERINDGKNDIFIADAGVFMSFIGAKRLFNELKKAIEEYEKKNGNIKLP
ncbi:MAG: DUF3467 domain-containing protein [Nanoarchaeota archaeon]